jgi:GntR family transcriptional regulator/MocR family aminotransferase
MRKKSRIRAPVELPVPLSLARNGDQPLHRQLYEQLRQAILEGRLVPGTRLPSTRTLKIVLGVSRNNVIAAFEELFAEGYLTTQHGSGTFVAEDLPELPRPKLAAPSQTPRWLRQKPTTIAGEEITQPETIEFRLGTTSTTSLPTQTWRSVWREVAKCPLPNDYGSPGGEPALRAALASYLGRSRGVACQADDVVITSGTVQALDLIARATLAPGDLVGVEDPGYPLARHVFQMRQAQLLPLPVDENGLQVHALPHGTSAPLLVYVTPSHQYPLATRLSIARRIMLLEWARAHESLVIEDDYDSEFRFDAPPLPALAGLDTAGQVAYIGSFSKVLSPALRVGYLVAPPPLRERIEQYKMLTDYHTSWPVQRALTIFLAEGHLERHIQRMRHQYAEKRAFLYRELAPISHIAQLRGLEAGLHAYLELPVDLPSKSIADEARKRGVLVTTLDEYYLGLSNRNGLILGYGGLELHEIVHGVHVLIEVIKKME